ncbi:MAG: hypothetical protein HY748_15445 [Elusimicrobia bacterium]|nr:hypothetical protein [Elusimicrobiota bacterium]
MRRTFGVLLTGLLLLQAPGPLAAQTLARVVAAPVSGAAIPVPLGSRTSLSLPASHALEAPSAGALRSLSHASGVLRTQTELPVVSAPGPGASFEPASLPKVERRDGVLTVNGVEIPAAEEVADMDPGSARSSGDEVMDALLGVKPEPDANAEGLPELGGDLAVAVSGARLLAPSHAAPAEEGQAPAPLPAPSAHGSGPRTSIFRSIAGFLRGIAGGMVYGTRILHLHYPHRSWDRIAGDMAADDKVKATNGEHPVGALREILNRTGWTKDNPAGLSISFTPALMEIGRKLWGMGWVQRWREAIGWRTASDGPRMEMLLTGYHFLYGLLPWGQAADALVRWNVKYHELLMKEFWGEPAPRQMKIFRPPEVGFSPEMVPALVKAGVQVVIVDSHHVSRSLKGYDATGMPNLPPPNKADQRNPASGQLDHYTSGKDGRTSKDVLPYSYLPHWLRYVDSDGKEYKLRVFPMAGGPSYIAGYQDFPNDVVQDIARFAAEGRPLVLGLDTDGDNAWGGGYSSYMESMPRLAHWLDANGHQFGTIQEYLTRYPVPVDDVLTWVEPGAWPNADWGTPQLSRWLWPPIKTAGVPMPRFDPTAWNFKLQFHSLLAMAVHWLLQGEAAMKAKVPGWELDMAKVVKADTDPSAGPLEKAVQQVLRAFDSGHVYYGPEPDFVQIPLLAAKAAMEAAKAAMGADAPRAAPTIWGPNRFPWNPGGENRGEVYGWRSHTYAPEFDVYGFVYSAAGLKRVELKWRVSQDGRTSPADENLSYGGGARIGPWNSMEMAAKDPYPQAEWAGLAPGDRVHELPRMVHARVSPGNEVLVDYYVEAEDGRGGVQRSPIMHVYVGKTGGGSANNM